MQKRHELPAARTPVLIIGGGTAGLTLAGELGQRGVACLLIESREATNTHPRASSLGPRSMEHFRRWGIAERMIERGVPLDFSLDVVFTTRLCEHEIRRLTFPTTGEALESSRTEPLIPELEWSPYFKVQAAQSVVEPTLREFAESFPHVDIRFGWRLEGFEIVDDGVQAVIVRNQDSQRMHVRARFLVGCDGARSTVRSSLGLQYEGRGVLARNQGIYFKSAAFEETYGRRQGRLLWTLAPDTRGVFIAIDGRGGWTYNRYFAEENERLDASAVCRAMGRDFPLEVISVQAWTGYQLVAERYRHGPVFFAGDAAHLFHPTGGFGMNTAIGDGVDLGWKLAAVIQGWGGEALLDSYESERRPVGVLNTVEASGNFDRLVSGLMQLPEAIERDDAEGKRLRQQASDSLDAQVRTWTASGRHLGYAYDDSPIIISDGSPAEVADARFYQPDARPGARAPHLWLEDGTSTLDLFDGRFVLLDLGNSGSGATALADAAREAGMPLRLVPLADSRVREAYQASLVLVRPDGHVAWRGESLSMDPAEMIDQVRGAGARLFAGHASNASLRSGCTEPGVP
ncbi:MAG: FAD-dependent monooxygenase [Pigmentiphaga sp.]